MLMLLLTSFLVSNPFEDFDFKKCLKEPAEVCVKNLVTHSKEGAEDFLRRQCFETQINQACLTLGKMYSLQNKDALAEGPLAFACGHNLGEACVEAGYAMERQGKEKASDDYYLFGCLARSHAASCSAYAQNARERRDWDESFKFFQKSCDAGSSAGCMSAAEASIFAKKNMVSLQANLYKKACDLDDVGGCLKLAYFFEETNDKPMAMEFFKKSCLREIEEACQKFKELNGGGLVTKALKEDAKKAEGFLQRAFEWLFPLDERLSK